jgi:hypothetical protein
MYTILVSMGKKKQNALVVVGIDFGTTYSGYGYSFRAEYKNDHSTISSDSDWKSGDGLVTIKTPTVILFDENGKFQSFGYETILPTYRQLVFNIVKMFDQIVSSSKYL